MQKKQCVFNWSGGKDSTLALHYALQDPELEVKYLLTTINEAHHRVSIHGVRVDLLRSQAKSIGIPLIEINLPEFPSMEDYSLIMLNQMTALRQKGITHAIFGDIFLEDLKTYREEKLKQVDMECIFPIWKKDTKQLINDFLNLGYKTILVCVQERIESFCGRVIDESFISDLPQDIDPCGENGEFHTFAFEGPIFKQKINFKTGEKVYRTFPSPNKEEKPIGFWYIDLKLSTSSC